MSEECLTFLITDSVAEITLNRPKQYNAFNSKLRKDLPELLEKLESMREVRVVVIRGSGPGFTAGADLNEGFPPPISEHLEKEYKPIFDQIVKSRLLYVASVHGSAAGIGSALALACDFLIMSKSAKLSMIFSNIGLVPDGGATWLLEKALGYRQALQLVVEGGKLSSDECVQCGLANKVVEDDKLHEESSKWAHLLASRPPLASSAAKRLLRKAPSCSYDEAFMAEAFEQDKVSVSEDFKNAVISFFKKEKPTFKGE